MSTYLVFFEVIHDRYDSGQEYIVSSSNELIRRFRSVKGRVKKAYRTRCYCDTF